jgi:hypothetical protein
VETISDYFKGPSSLSSLASFDQGYCVSFLGISIPERMKCGNENMSHKEITVKNVI